MNIWVVGTGYVGLVTGLCFAKMGHQVWCIDQDSRKIDALSHGISPIFEPGMTELILEVQAQGNVQFSTTFPTSVPVDVALIAVGTPPRQNGEADLSQVFAVVETLAHHLPQGALVATKSTVPVGTAARIRRRLSELQRADLEVASVPEFLREGSAIHDTLNPHRLIFGVFSTDAQETLEGLHRGLTSPVLVCEPATAEMIKYASNAFLATKISFVNEIANICERVGADVTQVAAGMGLDPRIGQGFLRAGLGYGGSCFPKDTRALVNIAGNVHYDFTLLRAVVEVNQRQRLAPLYRLLHWFENLEGVVVTILGVAFKPGTDDTRESPALDLASALISHGATVRLVDPVVKTAHTAGQKTHLSVSQDVYASLLDADAAVLVTEWEDFLSLDWAHVRDLMRAPFWFDGRNVLDKEALEQAGLVLANIGHQTRSAKISV
ncbi:UDP-glucose/GDP-mannose dehydrogenase family protein [Alicyclobacillus curvatus]|nr:UDP-glucose/GDP-mannose dehydrogenase family protein [Alicyclobacillus curvatus]